MRPKAFFLSEETLKKRAFIDENFQPGSLTQAIISVMEEKLHPVLGTALYNKLINGIADNSLSEDETSLLKDYVTPAMLYYVMEEAVFDTHIKFKNTGLSRITQENTETLTMSEMYDVMNRYKSKGEFQEQRLIKYLQQNSAKFPEYLNPGTGVDVIRPDKSGYTCPIVLD